MCVCVHVHTYVCGHVCMCTYVETRRQQLARLAGQEGPEVLLFLVSQHWGYQRVLSIRPASFRSSSFQDKCFINHLSHSPKS